MLIHLIRIKKQSINQLPQILGQTKGYQIVAQWLAKKDFQPFQFQTETWQHIINGNSGLVNAPTGCGKTYSVYLGSIIQFINQHPSNYQSLKNNGLQLLWVTPLRALAKDIGRAMEEVIIELGMQWKEAFATAIPPPVIGKNKNAKYPKC